MWRKIETLITESCIGQSNMRLKQFQIEDIDLILEDAFKKYDKDANKVLSRFQFPQLFSNLIQRLGGETPKTQDVDDIFNLLDINGDEAISKKLLEILLQNNIEVKVLQNKQTPSKNIY